MLLSTWLAHVGCVPTRLYDDADRDRHFALWLADAFDPDQPITMSDLGMQHHATVHWVVGHLAALSRRRLDFSADESWADRRAEWAAINHKPRALSLRARVRAPSPLEAEMATLFTAVGGVGFPRSARDPMP